MEKKFQTSLCDAIPDSYPTAWRELVVHPTPTDFTTRLVQAAGLEQPVRKRLEKPVRKGLEQPVRKGLEQPVETGLEQPVETGLEQPVRSGVAQEEEERHNLHGEEGEHPPGQASLLPEPCTLHSYL
ncbi:hypothetical protein T484DRAFT_1821737 [Baffinella frigidus]|nr:hypothetical protein T484DRAFT_1821737 [Cryptophyta sp. CCMP2293]